MQTSAPYTDTDPDVWPIADLQVVPLDASWDESCLCLTLPQGINPDLAKAAYYLFSHPPAYLDALSDAAQELEECRASLDGHAVSRRLLTSARHVVATAQRLSALSRAHPKPHGEDSAQLIELARMLHRAATSLRPAPAESSRTQGASSDAECVASMFPSCDLTSLALGLIDRSRLEIGAERSRELYELGVKIASLAGVMATQKPKYHTQGDGRVAPAADGLVPAKAGD